MVSTLLLLNGVRRGSSALWPRMTTESGGAAACTIPRQHPRNPAVFAQIRPHFIHTLHHRARLGPLPLPDGSRTFRARREGMPPDLVRKRQRFGRGEAMANAVPLAGGALSGASCKASHRAGVFCLPDGRGGSPVRACGGHGASFRARVRAGTRAQSISRGPSRPRPGQPGWRALKRGG
jgi:hypothetical protein